jgi:peptidoglycan-associated lipoprotein
MRVSVALILVGLIVVVGCSPEKKAMKSFRYGKYENVIDYYKGVVKKDPSNGRANYFIAESYRLSNRVKEAEPFYARAKGKGVNPDSVKLYYAKSLQANAKYNEARNVLEELESLTNDDKIKSRAQREIEGIDYLDKLAQKKSYYKIKNLEAINTPFTEYAPVYSNNELYFTSLMKDVSPLRPMARP